MKRLLTQETLNRENLVFAGTAGVSAGNCRWGFSPGFYDTETGRMEISRFANGKPAPVHLLDGLPEPLVVERDSFGHVTAVKRSIIAGFIRDGCFYTRAQVAKACLL